MVSVRNMSNAQIVAAAKRAGACDPAVEWLEESVHDLRTAVRECPEQDWLVWGMGSSVAWLRMALSAGAAVDATDSSGRTPLHLAAQWGQAAVAEALLSAGAAAGATDKDGMTPLHLAAGGGHAGCVSLLRAHGATD